MMLIDTHTHLYLPEFDADRDDSVNRAVNSGVVKLLLPNIDLDSVNQLLTVADSYAGICHPMIGLHPTSVKKDYLEEIGKLLNLASEYRFCAVGEIGIDLYWDRSFLKEQIDAFRIQVRYAIDSGLPVVIHSRDSFPEVFNALEEFRGSDLNGVFHAFTGSFSDADKAVGMGFKLGIGGIVTFKNSGLDKVVKEAGIENIILETDSPYLAPVPHRGKRNESSYLTIINKKVAEIFGITEEESASVTYDNSVRLFGI
jgi:TatD DNase family protein